MIPIYAGTGGERGDPTRLAIAFNGLTLNNPSDDPQNTYEVNTSAPLTNLDYVSELNQGRDGMEIYAFRKVNKIETLQGFIRAGSLEALADKIVALGKAFDPALIGHDHAADPFTNKLTFSVPTTDTTTFPSGLVSSFYYALPMRVPEPIINFATGLTAAFDITMIMRDPRRYYATQGSKSGGGSISNTIGNYPSPATLTITMAGAGSATYKAQNTTTVHGAQALTLDLSGLSASDVVVVNMDRKTITINGTSDMSPYVSGDYWHIDPGTNTIAYTNGTNATSVVTYYPAFSA